MSYKSTRRQWVKLWVNEWLDGTTRFELTAPQRLLWIDLLALAGRSRFPGYVYAGEGEAGKKVGYPIAYLAGVLQMDEVTLNNALKLLQQHHRITLEETGPEQYVIGIINWEKYQSEYLRQKAYRKVTTQTTSRLPVEGEEEGNVDGDVETHMHPRVFSTPAFEKFYAAYPWQVDKQEANKEWFRIRFVEEQAEKIMAGLEVWIASDRWKDQQYIPSPVKFLKNRRWEALPPKKAESKNEQALRKTREAIQRNRAHRGMAG